MIFDRKALLLFTGVVIVIIGTFTWYAWSFAQRGMQVRTFSNMKIISRTLQEAEGSLNTVSPDPQRSSKIINKYSEGRDAWGNDLLFIVSESKGNLLISKGRDNVLDVESPDEYFSLERKDVKYRFNEDIVFRNYEPITLAGK